jgi:pimeloyl-ACP methyl ester carboxylesterase
MIAQHADWLKRIAVDWRDGSFVSGDPSVHAQEGVDGMINLVSGGGTSLGYWPIVRAARREGFDVVACPYDFRTISGSDEWTRFCDSMQSALTGDDFDRVIVLGHSLGGLVAHAFLREHGSSIDLGRLSAVVCVCSPWAGSVRALVAALTGTPIGPIGGADAAAWVQTTVRCYSGLLLTLPNERAIGTDGETDPVVLELGDRTFRASEMQQILEQTGNVSSALAYRDNVRPWMEAHGLLSVVDAPLAGSRTRFLNVYGALPHARSGRETSMRALPRRRNRYAERGSWCEFNGLAIRERGPDVSDNTVRESSARAWRGLLSVSDTYRYEELRLDGCEHGSAVMSLSSHLEVLVSRLRALACR